MKKLCRGSLSMLLAILALAWAALGDTLLTQWGLTAWTRSAGGLHYTWLYTLILLVPAVLLGIRFPRDRFARLGAAFALTMAVIRCFAAAFALFA